MPNRKDQIRAAMDKHDKPIPKTTTGKGKNYLPTSEGAGMTAKGRAEYNAKNGSHLQAPQASGSRHDSFCARMKGVVANAKGDAPRAKASLRRWHCG
jgi:Domain of unknown function (DUF6321)